MTRFGRWTRAVLPVLGGLAIALTVFAVVEVGWRAVLGPPPADQLPDNFRYAHLDILKPYFKRTTQGQGRAIWSPQREQSQSVSFAMPKPEGVSRIVILGGSIAVPFSEEEASKLQTFLGRALPGRRTELLACGMGAYDSRRESLLLRELLDYSPDLVILLSGNNEYYNIAVPHPRLFLLRHHLRAFWTYRKLESLFELLGWHPGPQSQGNTDADAGFEKNLRAMARMSRARGVPLVLLTLGANLRDSPPSSPEASAENPIYFEAMRAWEEGRYGRAAEGFRKFLTASPRDPFAHYYLAKSLERLGKPGSAAEHYLLAADYDQPGERSSPRRNDIIRRVAREEGAILADVEKLFRTLSPQGIPGRELFRDPCHWHREYYPLVSLTVLRAVYVQDLREGVSALAPAGAWRWDWASGLDAALRAPKIDPKMARHYFEDMLYTALAHAIVLRRDQMWEASVDFMQQALRRHPAWFESLTESAASLTPLYQKHWFQERRQHAAEDWPAVLVHIGEAYRREGRTQVALEKFSQALASQPYYFQARLRHAIALASLGRWPRAAAGFDSLIRDYPECRELKLWKAHFQGRR